MNLFFPNSFKKIYKNNHPKNECTAYECGSNERGNVLMYILIAVVLFGALTAALTRGSGEQAQTTGSFRIAEDLVSQAQGIRAALLECTLVYRNGGDFPEVADIGVPIDLEEVECVPINGSAPFKVFKGRASVYKPQPPPPFEDWTYHNDAEGNVVISIATPEENSTDLMIRRALEMVADKYTDNEAYIVCNGGEAIFSVFLTGEAPEDMCP